VRLVLIAEPDLRERLRCVRCIAGQTSVSAAGVGTWEELEHSLEGVTIVSLILYAPSLPGAPGDAIERLRGRTQRLIVASADGPRALGAPDDGLMRVQHPVPQETLILLARSAGMLSSQHAVSFSPADVLQVLCMSGESHVLVVSREGADTGVIELREGQVWTAYDALGVGEEAFARLIRPEMRARVSPQVPSAKERTLWKGLSELLLDSIRRMDEGSVVCPPPLSSRPPEIALAAAAGQAARVKELTLAARRMLMERSYDEAARTLERLAELDAASPLVRANLEQLRKLGYPR
jgi:hypothetical protein